MMMSTIVHVMQHVKVKGEVHVENLTSSDHEIATCVSSPRLILAIPASFRALLTKVLIGLIRTFQGGQSYFVLSFSVTISNLWFLFDLPLLNEGDSECEKIKACQHASFRLKDGEEVKNEKERRKEKKEEKKDGQS